MCCPSPAEQEPARVRKGQASKELPRAPEFTESKRETCGWGCLGEGGDSVQPTVETGSFPGSSASSSQVPLRKRDIMWCDCLCFSEGGHLLPC